MKQRCMTSYVVDVSTRCSSVRDKIQAKHADKSSEWGGNWEDAGGMQGKIYSLPVGVGFVHVVWGCYIQDISLKRLFAQVF